MVKGKRRYGIFLHHCLIRLILLMMAMFLIFRPYGIAVLQLGSSIERMAIERPLEARCASFKAVHFPKGAKRW